MVTTRAATSQRNYIEAELKLVQERLKELPTLDKCTTVQEKKERLALNQQRAILLRAQKDLVAQGARSSSREVNAIITRNTMPASYVPPSTEDTSSLPPPIEVPLAPSPPRAYLSPPAVDAQPAPLPSNNYFPSSPIVTKILSPPRVAARFVPSPSTDTQPAQSSSHDLHPLEADSPANVVTPLSAVPASPVNHIWEVPSEYRGWAYTNAAPVQKSIGVSPSKVEQILGKRPRKQSQRLKEAEKNSGSTRGQSRRRGS
jgi:hypothetical protein